MKNIYAIMIGLMLWGFSVSVLAQSNSGTDKSKQANTIEEYELNENLGTIQSIRFEGLHALSPEIVADIATLQVGDPLTYQKLDHSITDLRKWGVFSQVEVYLSFEDDGINLVYDLKEGFVIKDIRIKGNFPLLKKEVQRALFLNRGRIYDSSKLPEQIDRIDRLYENEGYFGTTIFAFEEFDEKNQQVTITFKIQKGPTYRLRNYTIEGNTALNEKRIRTIIFTYFHYKPKQIKKDLNKIQKLYKKKGFVRARVKLDGESYDYDARKVDLDILIKQGPWVKVTFEGNDHFFNKTLRSQITIYRDGDYDEFEIEASKKRLLSFYLQRGYEEVEIDWERQKISKKEYHITFKIKEGPQRQVKAVKFFGNESIPSKRLIKLLSTKINSIGVKGYYLENLFEEDLRSIERFYREEGFPDARVKYWDREYSELGDKVTLLVFIEEGKQRIVEDLEFSGISKKLQSDFYQDLLLRPGQPYSPYRLSEDLQTILVSLSNHGYPYAEVKHDTVDISEIKKKVLLTVEKGKQVKIGRVLFIGNNQTQEKVLRQNLRIQEGDIFSTKKILQSQINLRGLGIFDSVNLETLGLSSQREVVNLIVRLQERKNKIVDLEAGYETDRGFRGKIVFNKLNLWGRGKNGNIKAQIGTQLSRFEINYIDPRVYGSSFQLVVGAFASNENRPFFDSRSVGAYTTLFKPFGPRLSAYGRLDFNYVNFDDGRTVFEKINPTPNPPERTRLITSAGVTYDTRDNFGDPTKGLYLNGRISLTDQFIQLGGNYFTARANIGNWYSIFPKLTIANALRVAQIWKIPNDTSVPVDDRLYLGGDDTVRGFSQDSLLPSGGTFSLVHNLELQFRVFGNIQLVGFLDTGVVTNSISDVNLNTLRHSGGFGARYITPVGPIRVDYGIVLDPKPSDSTSRFHFTFGYFF